MKVQRNHKPFYVWNGNPNSKWPLMSIHEDALLVSEDHPRNREGVFTSGGPFLCRKYESTIDTFHVRWVNNNVVWDGTPWVGYGTNVHVWATPTDTLKNIRTVQMANTFSYGATGWKRARPGNPAASIATIVAEAREGLPTLPKRLFLNLKGLLDGKAKAKRLGYSGSDDFLNVTMGWMPLLSDLRKLYKLSNQLDKRLAEIYRQNGKGIHRRRTIKDLQSSTSTETNYAHAFGGCEFVPPNWQAATSKKTVVTTNIEKVWFVGKFRYYIPDIGSTQWRRRTIAALYGANITPEAVYQIMPWSWLFDWFGNIGDVMSNISTNAVENETCDYAYVMRTYETRKETYVHTQWQGLPPSTSFGLLVNVPPGSARLYARDSEIIKARSVGSPFGFGATFDGLSAYQTGVAAALGISRWAS